MDDRKLTSPPALVLPFLKPKKRGTQNITFISPNRRGRSTADPVAYFKITSAYARRETVLTVFYLEKRHMIPLGTPYPSTTIFPRKRMSFLSDRTFRVRLASFFLQFESVPQDNVLSTTLFLNVVNRLVYHQEFGHHCTYIIQLSLLLVLPYPLFIRFSSLQHQSPLGLPTTVFFFLPLKHFPSFFLIHIQAPSLQSLYDTPIQFCRSGKFLGVIFDSQPSAKSYPFSCRKSPPSPPTITLSHISWCSDRKSSF